MKSQKKSNKLVGTGLITAFAASLCCITPVLALIAGTSGIAASFSWIEPARPYLIGITVVVLAFAWYQKLKSRKADTIECDCEEEKPSFRQSEKFLLLVTVFAVLMLAFPSYSHIFYQETKKEVVVISPGDIEILHLDIKGMTCESCNLHIENTVMENNGVIDAKADYKTGTAEIKIDKTKISPEDVVEEINKTGYKVITIKSE